MNKFVAVNATPALFHKFGCNEGCPFGNSACINRPFASPTKVECALWCISYADSRPSFLNVSIAARASFYITRQRENGKVEFIYTDSEAAMETIALEAKFGACTLRR